MNFPSTFSDKPPTTFNITASSSSFCMREQNSQREHHSSLTSTPGLDVRTLWPEDWTTEDPSAAALGESSDSNSAALEVTCRAVPLGLDSELLLVGCSDGYVRILDMHSLTVLQLLNKGDIAPGDDHSQKTKAQIIPQQSSHSTEKDAAERSPVTLVQILAATSTCSTRASAEEKSHAHQTAAGAVTSSFDVRVLICLANGDVQLWSISIVRNESTNMPAANHCAAPTNLTRNRREHSLTKSQKSPKAAARTWRVGAVKAVYRMNVKKRLLLQKGGKQGIDVLTSISTKAIGTSSSKGSKGLKGSKGVKGHTPSVLDHLSISSYFVDADNSVLGCWIGSNVCLFSMQKKNTGMVAHHGLFQLIHVDPTMVSTVSTVSSTVSSTVASTVASVSNMKGCFAMGDDNMILKGYTHLCYIDRHPSLPPRSLLMIGKGPFLDLWHLKDEVHPEHPDQGGGRNVRNVRNADFLELVHSWDVRRLMEGLPSKVKCYAIHSHPQLKHVFSLGTFLYALEYLYNI